MKPVIFDKSCVMFAENQDEYITLPVEIVENNDGKIYISCWKPSLWERIKILFIGEIYLSILGMQPPVRVETERLK